MQVAPQPASGRRRHPLGLLLYRVGSIQPVKTRLWAALVLGVCLAILALAAWLEPDPKGFGTHCQLGLAPCSLPATLGIPCAGCGMTTAFAHTVRGQWWAALQAQPAGWVLCLATLVSAGLALSALISGRPWRLNLYRATPFRITLVVVGLLLGGWAYKIIVMLADPGIPATW